MLKSNKHIEIVRSTISGLSSMSQRSCDAMLTVLAKHYTKVGVTVINCLSDLEVLLECRPDLVFLGMEFIPRNPTLGISDPDKVWITNYLDENGIAYTGSNQMAHEIGRDKSLAKRRVVDAGLATSPFFVIKQNQLPVRGDQPLIFPLFVKPTNRGGGVGIDSDSVVYDFEQLYSKAHSIAVRLRSDSLVEEYLPGREFSVAILQDEYSADFSVMPLELITPPNKQGARILGGKVKSLNTEQAVGVADEFTKSKVNELAVGVFNALGARDFGRIDIRLNQHGTPQFLEANLIPSLISGYGSFPKACMLNLNLEYEPMIIRIARLGLARKEDNIEAALGFSAAVNTAAPSLETVFGPA